MALVKYRSESGDTQNGFVTIKQEEAIELWLILKGEVEGNLTRQKQCENIDQIVMSWRDPTTPDSYIEARQDYIFPMVVAEWMLKPARTSTLGGQVLGWEPSKPDPSKRYNRQFSEIWGLLQDGKPTELARQYF